MGRLFSKQINNVIFNSIMAKAKVAAKEAKDAHNYTDTAGFTLKYDSLFC